MSALTDIYTLSLHDALPILFVANLNVAPRKEKNEFAKFPQGTEVERDPAARRINVEDHVCGIVMQGLACVQGLFDGDRKSTRLNSSHTVISYAVFCLKKKTN